MGLRYLICSFLFVCFSLKVYTQKISEDTLVHSTDKIKKGWNVGAFPVIGFSFDQGFAYGGLAHFYNFGDGKNYPYYNHSLYFECSATTLGSGINLFKYDSEHLIPHLRVTSEMGYFTEQALGFYGFNGYNAPYDKAQEDNNYSGYISNVYYRYDRKLLKLIYDLQGNITNHKLRWLLGYNFFKFRINTVDIRKMNPNDRHNDLTLAVPLLYDKYVSWGFIPENQKNGGDVSLIKTGIIWDSRDNEPNPGRGVWTEALLLVAPAFLGNKITFEKFIITHRQYLTIVRDMLTSAFRLSYQGKIGGTIPFYMMPVVFNSVSTHDGLGGAKTLRGILRNRIIGEDFLYGNIEMRWKVFKRYCFKQNFYGAIAGFTDFGRTTRSIALTPVNPEAATYLKEGQPESWHQSVGIGLYGAMNQNFIVSCNYGMAMDKRDGNKGMYVGLDFLF